MLFLLVLIVFIVWRIRNGALKGFWRDMRIGLVLLSAWAVVNQGYLHFGWFGAVTGVVLVGSVAWGCIRLAQDSVPKEKPPRFI